MCWRHRAVISEYRYVGLELGTSGEWLSVNRERVCEREVQTRPWAPESSVAGLELVVLHEGTGWQGATLTRGQAAVRWGVEVSMASNASLLHWQVNSLLLNHPGDSSGKESTCQCRRHKRRGFYPWVGKIP